MFDCCQSVPGRPVDVQQLGADWIVGAGHKMCGPTGSAFLWGRCVSFLSCHLFLSSVLALAFMGLSDHVSVAAQAQPDASIVGGLKGCFACHTSNQATPQCEFDHLALSIVPRS